MEIIKTLGLVALGAILSFTAMHFMGLNVGGTTNFDTLSLSEDLTVSDALNVTGAVDVSTFTQGGGVTATATRDAAQTLVVTDFDTENVIDVTQASTSATLTLPATSTMTAVIPNAGDMRTIWIRNASTSASAALTIAVGTGMTLKNGASSTVLLIGDTDGDNTMRVDMVRKADTDINVYMYKYQD
jgi:hypothetical protein